MHIYASSPGLGYKYTYAYTQTPQPMHGIHAYARARVRTRSFVACAKLTFPDTINSVLGVRAPP